MGTIYQIDFRTGSLTKAVEPEAHEIVGARVSYEDQANPRAYATVERVESGTAHLVWDGTGRRSSVHASMIPTRVGTTSTGGTAGFRREPASTPPQAPPALPESNEYRGPKYDRNLTTTEVAARLRETIKREQKAGTIAKGVKVSVRAGGVE